MAEGTARLATHCRVAPLRLVRASQHPSDDIIVYEILLSNSGREVGFIHDNLIVRSLRYGSRCLEGCCSFHDVSSNTALMVLYSGIEVKHIFIYLPEWLGGGQLTTKVPDSPRTLSGSAPFRTVFAASAQYNLAIRSHTGIKSQILAPAGPSSELGCAKTG